MKVDIGNRRKFIGREGWNVRFRLEVWTNTTCRLMDPRGFESSGYKYWDMYEGQVCGQVMHSKKEMQTHLKEYHGQSN